MTRIDNDMGWCELEKIRETSANTVSQMLNAMPAEDLQTLIMFCAAIVAYGRQGATGVNSLIGR